MLLPTLQGVSCAVVCLATARRLCVWKLHTVAAELTGPVAADLLDALGVLVGNVGTSSKHTAAHTLSGYSMCITIWGITVAKRMQVWERVHVAAAVVVVVFGVVHSRKVWVSLAPGIVLYGIDVAHRWLQASRTATARLTLSASSQVLSAVVPLQVCCQLPEHEAQ
jgi:hypothetical protein